MSETEIKKAILDGLESEMKDAIHVFRVWCGHTVAKKGGHIVGAKNGTPDLCGFFRSGPNAGVFLGIETKQPKAGFRPDQYEFALVATKARAIVISAVSWEDCRGKLREYL